MVSRRTTSNELLDVFRTAIGDEIAGAKSMHVFDIHDTKASAAGASANADDELAIGELMLACIVEGDADTNGDTHARHLRRTMRFAGGSLRSAFALHAERFRRAQCQNLLNISQRLLSNIGDLGQLLRSVMVEAKDMTAAERCSLFLLDDYTGELVSKVFDGDESKREIRIASGQGIAGNVAKTGRLLNIRDAYAHPLFYKGVDEMTGFKTRNLLCFPISNEQKVIGVAQLCNKVGGFVWVTRQ